MCGLVGVLTKRVSGFSNNETKAFRQMLYVDALRGMDSTGVFGVNKNGSVSVMKQAVDALRFINTKAYENWDTEMFREGRMMVGHNRSATKGTVVDDNAHPFTEGHITLVHNGTLYFHKELADTEVDSHAICKSIASRGYKETLKMVDGAFALIWFDMDVNKLFITRNSKRTLGMAFNEKKDSIYIASEVAMLPWIASRNGEKLDKLMNFNEETKDNKGFVFTIDLDTFEFDKETVDFYKPKSTYQQQNWKTHSPAWYDWEADPEYQSLKEQYKTEQETKTEVKPNNVVQLPKQQQSGGTANAVPFGTSGSHLSSIKGNFRDVITLNTPLDPKEFNSSQFWMKGDKTIIFALEDSLADGNGHSIMGTFRGVSVDGYVTSDEELDKLEKYQWLRGDVSTCHFLNDKLTRIVINNIQPQLYKFSRNGELINSERWEQISGNTFCDDCGFEVGINDIEDAVFRFDKATGLPRRIVCGDCINDKEKQYKPEGVMH